MPQPSDVTTLDDATPEPPDVAPRSDRRAVVGLVVATAMWGFGFTWAKAAGEGVHRAAGLPDGSAFGPILVLACRFGLAALVLFAAVPATRRGWTVRGARRIGGIGLLMATGLVLQHLGLDLTSEAVSAFLTNLTVLFVPLLVLVVTRRPPAPVLWLGVALATAGVWMMTGATPAGFGVGELLGLACAVMFALQIVAVNAVAVEESAWRMVAGQFVVVAAVCAGACVFTDQRGPHNASGLDQIVTRHSFWANVTLLIVFPTVAAYTLMNFLQPRLDPTRAALVYLLEPIFAAVWAMMTVGRALTGAAVAGAVLILAANAGVELLARRRTAAAAAARARRDGRATCLPAGIDTGGAGPS